MIISRDIIKSRNNDFVKYAASLSTNKGRKEAESFIAEGLKLTLEGASAGLPITHCIVNEDRQEQILPRLCKALDKDCYKKTVVVIVSSSVFEKISTEKAPQGVISIIKYLDFFFNMNIIYKEEFFLAPKERAIALYSVRDPSNLGSVIRSAAAMGVDHIVLSGDCADIYNPKTVRSSMGSLFRVKVTTVEDFDSFIEASRFNGRRVFAAELRDGALSLLESNISSRDIVIIGNEGHGIPSEISEMCDGSVYIPISSEIESLNASVAAALFMWEQMKK